MVGRKVFILNAISKDLINEKIMNIANLSFHLFIIIKKNEEFSIRDQTANKARIPLA